MPRDHPQEPDSLTLFLDETILKQAEMSKLAEPNRKDLEFLRTWLQRPCMGNFSLVGLDRNAWHETNEKDLLAVRSRPRTDLFSAWTMDTVVPWLLRMQVPADKV